MDQLDLVLNKNEKLLWSGRPKFWPYVITRVLILGIVIFAFLGVAILYGLPKIGIIYNNNWNAISTIFWSDIIISFGVSMILVRLWWKVAFYGVTDKRVIIQGGIFGRGFTYIDYDKIQNATVNVGLVDKIFKTGSVRVFSGQMGGRYGNAPLFNSLSNITNPYDVFKLFDKTEFDVKTDMNYPNELRPKENPGYNTEYKPENSENKD